MYLIVIFYILFYVQLSKKKLRRSEAKAAAAQDHLDAEQLKAVLGRQEIITAPDGNVYLVTALKPEEMVQLQQQLASAQNVEAAVDQVQTNNITLHQPTEHQPGLVDIFISKTFIDIILKEN
jgi:hypothetical protein